MEQDTTAKPQSGSWANLNTEESDRREKVAFEINKPVIVTFDSEFKEPREYPNQGADGVFYVFDCRSAGEDRAIVTSAWSLLRGLKLAEPLAGKSVKISKVMKDGRQHYEVEAIDAPIKEESLGEH